MTTSVRTIVRAAVFLAATLLAATPARAGLPVSCTNFTDTPLVAGTLIKAVHLTQLRTCVNALRAERALGPASWTDATIVTQVTVVKAVHITELRAALGDAYLATGHAAPAFGAAPVAGQTVIAASFFTDLRSAIADTPNPCVVSLSPSSLTVGQAGGSASVALQAPCPWTASSSAAWLTLAVATSSGSQTLGFSYEANSGLERHATIAVNGIEVTITQPGAGDPIALVNADFEEGFSPVGGEGNPGLLATGWDYMGDPNWVLFDRAGVPGDYEQYVEQGTLFQNITVLPETTYVVTADVQVDGSPGSAVKLYMHMAPYVQDAHVQSFGGGASRLRLEYHTPAAPTGEGNARIGFSVVSGTFKVDHVQVVPLSWETAHERVTNGEFEASFEPPIDHWQSHGLLADGWARVGVSSSAVVFSFEESNTGLRQTIEHANDGDGIGQTVSVIPEQPYLLRAIVSGPFRAARVGIGPVGAPATHTVVWCDAGGLPQTLWLLYTPPAGQTAVTVSVTGARDDASFAVDSVSLMPTTLTSVEPGAAQGGCVQRHTLTFEVHEAGTLAPVEGALVEISPTSGSGPARFTYPDGTISYQVAAEPLSYVITKAGYHTRSGVISVESALTLAVELLSGTFTGSLSIDPAYIAVPADPGIGSISVNAPSDYNWTATSVSPFLTITQGQSGTGNGVIQYSVAANEGDDRVGRIYVDGLVQTVAQAGAGEGAAACVPRPPANTQFGLVTQTYNIPDETKLAKLGAGSVRLSMFWSEWQPSPGPIPQYTWDYWDEKLRIASCRGLDVLLSISRTPSWAGPSGTAKPTDLQHWEDFVHAVLDHYGLKYPNVTFGIWNEPNLEEFFEDDDIATNWLQLWRHANIAREAVSPTIRLAGPETSAHAVGEDGARYFKKAYEGMSQSLRPHDVITVHYYGFHHEDYDDPIFKYVEKVRSIVGSSREIWLSEVGDEEPSDSIQTNYLVNNILEPFTQRTTPNWTKIFVYQLHTHCPFCLVSDNWNDRQSFSTYMNYISSPQELTVTLQAAAGNYLSAENGGGGMLTASASAPGANETFVLLDYNGGGIVSGDTVSLRTANSFLIRALNGGGESVDAGSLAALKGEDFVIYSLSTSDGPILSGDSVALRALSSGTSSPFAGFWLTAESDGSVNASVQFVGVSEAGPPQLFVIRY